MLLSQGIAQSLNELKYEFTVDQVFMFFEKYTKRRLNLQRDLSVSIAHAVSYASIPPMGADRSYMNSKQRTWDKYLRSLDLDSKAQQKDIRSVKSALTGAGIPIKVKKKGEY